MYASTVVFLVDLLVGHQAMSKVKVQGFWVIEKRHPLFKSLKVGYILNHLTFIIITIVFILYTTYTIICMNSVAHTNTGFSSNIVFFSKILVYFPDSVFSRCQCMYTRRAGRTPVLQQNWQSLENSKKF